ncbi:hypothetical protein [Acinetobacter calcoaceticus]|uniref:hypothetical protein n=1 Tax=Acinetobacter calcoaceticus TaxID=471 RepID=UPI0028632C0D|nr:hypothetical protein [Acinetobacter calcoaceticus]MDR6798347.1 hypothetical protein [Acinetobacter calcoaceticus]
MKLVTVIELSKQTGLTRSQIYYLNKEHNLLNSDGKINLEDALNIITALKIKKAKITNEENFRQILNMLHLQNIALQKQLDLANEREKNYIAELANYRQHLLLKITKNSSIHESDAQTELENSGFDTDRNYRKPMQFESENQASRESCQSINKETKSTNEIESHPISTESIRNEMTLPASESGETGLIRSEKEISERNHDALIGTPLPNQNDKNQNPILKRRTHSTAQVVKGTSKSVSISLTARNPNSKPANEKIAGQDDLNKKDHHDSEQ